MIDGREQYYDERPPAVKQRELDDAESRQILRR
jgi:hypothetical protein